MALYNLINDKGLVKQFFTEVMPPLDPERPELTYFVSLSARNKYLSESERENFGIGRSEMFARSSIHGRPVFFGHWARFVRDTEDSANNIQKVVAENTLREITKLEVEQGGYTGRKSGLPMPVAPHVITTYVNLALSDTVKAWAEVNSQMQKYLLDKAQGHSTTFPDVNTLLDTEIQRSQVQKKYVDVDVDVAALRVEARQELLDRILKNLEDLSPKPIKGYVVFTVSGFHILIDRSTLKFNYNKAFNTSDITEFLNEYTRSRSTDGNEASWDIETNKNYMVPLPGTNQPLYAPWREALLAGKKYYVDLEMVYPVTYQEFGHWDEFHRFVNPMVPCRFPSLGV